MYNTVHNYYRHIIIYECFSKNDQRQSNSTNPNVDEGERGTKDGTIRVQK